MITEGGLLGAIYEMMEDQSVGIKIELNKISIANLTKLICNYLDIDPLRLISSGSLLICSENEIESNSLDLDHNLIEIGTIIAEKKLFLDNTEIKPPEADQLILGLKNVAKLT